MRGFRQVPAPAFRLLAVALLALGVALPAAAENASPQPVDDPYGLVVPLPGCGMVGSVVSTPALHRVRAKASAPGKRPRVATRRTVRPAPAERQADAGALAWQALYGCAARVPEEAGATAGAGPVRPT